MRQLLAELHRRGIRLQLDGNELRVVAKAGALDDGIKASLRVRKAELVEMLRAGGALAGDDAAVLIEHDAAGRFEPFPLTELQHAYWLGRDAALEMGSVATHLYVELSCRDFDLARAGRALRRLIDQHDMLRAVVDGEGMQRVLPEVPAYEIATTDCRSAGADVAAAAAEAVRGMLSHQVLKADRWPLFDIRATLMPAGETRLHVSLDLLILDAWSIFLFFREWHALYERPDTKTAPDITYRDYLRAERAHRDTGRYRAAQAYWERRVEQLPPAPDLPLQADASARRAPRFARREARIARDRWDRLKDHARQRGLTPSGLLLAAYAAVLARWSASPHFTLNVTTGSRQPWHPGVHRLLGDFTSLVLHEVSRGDAPSSFAEFALAQQQRLLLDLEHGAFSGVTVRREWARRRGSGMQAAMPVVFSSGLVWSGDEEVGNLEQFGTKVFSISQTSQVWLDHHVMELGGDLVLIWDAAEAVFEPGVLDAMFEAYTTLVQRLVDDVALWDSSDPVTLPVEMARRRAAANDTAAPLPAQPLHAGIVAQALARPDAPAVVAAGRTMSFGELLGEAAAVADWLLAARVEPGQAVAVVMRKGWEQVVAVLGVLMSGAAYVPIDADLPTRRQEELLRLCAARQVLSQPGALRAANGGDWQAHDVLAGQRTPFGPAHRASLAAPLDRTAYIVFTSGTTGVPKGVMIDHAGAVNTVAAINRMFDVNAADRVLGVSSLSFDLSVYDIFGVLAAGGTLVLPDARAGHDPSHWLECMRSHGITLWNSAPQLMRMLLDGLAAGEPALQPLRAVLLSGDFIPLDLPDRLRNHGCAGRITSLGGATEASIWSIHRPIGDVAPHWQSIPYGRALPNQTVWVLDHSLHAAPDHVRGRIFIGGIGLAKGYLGDEARTAQRFIRHPRSGERLYDTGDLGRYDADGDIVILGRDDGQIKIRGHRVELGEIEAVLRRHPAVDQAVVLARPGAAGARHLVAYVVPQEAALPMAGAELGSFVAEQLPDYMVPRHVVALPALPLSANGKVDHAALPDPAADADDMPAKVEPRDACEQAVLEVWRRVIPDLDIGVTDNFFELGGDSVLATQLLRELNGALQLRLEMHELFENLTVEALARVVRQRTAPADDATQAEPTPSTLLGDADALAADVAAARAAIERWTVPFDAPEPNPRAVLLTGATGWVGAHLLATLLRATPARIVCLVRSSTDDAARALLFERMQQFGLAIAEPDQARVSVLAGDLQQRRFGLSAAAWSQLCRGVGRIYHLAASVGVLQGYALHRASNVQPLHDLLDLASTGRPKPVHTLSPMTVCRRFVDGRFYVLASEQVHESPAGLLTGYAQSKWVAEQVLWAASQRGVPVRIYRSSHALPTASGGRAKPNDTCATVLDVASRLDVVPDWPQARVNGVPVDRLCELLVEDSGAHAHESAVVHLEHRTPPALTAVLSELVRARIGAGEVVSVPLALWQRECLDAASRLPAAQQALARGLFESRSDRMAIENMFSEHAIDTGHIEARMLQERLTGLTPPHYWRQALGSQRAGSVAA